MTGRYVALATDYDGTLARHGPVEVAAIAALRRARSAGLARILVSGRELEGLQHAFDELVLFDMTVLENGALL